MNNKSLEIENQTTSWDHSNLQLTFYVWTILEILSTIFFKLLWYLPFSTLMIFCVPDFLVSLVEKHKMNLRRKEKEVLL